MNKYYQEVVLNEQDYLMAGIDGGEDDGKKSKPKKVGKVVQEAGKKLGFDALEIASFIRYETGEGEEASDSPRPS